MKSIQMPDGRPVPVLGQGTWKMGEGERPAKDEVAALRLGIDLGMTLIDTAEMYGDGRAEEMVGQAITGQRERVFVVTKVYPHNANRKGVTGPAQGQWAQAAAQQGRRGSRGQKRVRRGRSGRRSRPARVSESGAGVKIKLQAGAASQLP